LAGVAAGLRYYSPGIGRWLNRDPMGERGGRNVYASVHNDPIRGLDSLGETFHVIPHPEWSYPGWGETKASGPASVRMNIKADESCGQEGCYRLILERVTMLVEYWYVFWRPGVREHEELHVQDYRSIAYEETEAYARSKAGCYKTPEKAECWRNVMHAAASKFKAKADWKTILFRHQPLTSEEQRKSEGDFSLYETQSQILMRLEEHCNQM